MYVSTTSLRDTAVQGRIDGRVPGVRAGPRVSEHARRLVQHAVGEARLACTASLTELRDPGLEGSDEGRET